MPNGHDKNWVRVCAAVHGFRLRYGRWPTRVRVMPASFGDLVAHVLTPIGFALVSSYVPLVPEEGATVIAENGTGAEYDYGHEGFPSGELTPSTREWFGEAVRRPELGG